MYIYIYIHVHIHICDGRDEVPEDEDAEEDEGDEEEAHAELLGHDRPGRETVDLCLLYMWCLC